MLDPSLLDMLCTIPSKKICFVRSTCLYPLIKRVLGGIGAAARRARGAISEAMIGLNDYAIKLVHVDMF
jgi:hypothetical protein